jgi:hypothetical protein
MGLLGRGRDDDAVRAAYRLGQQKANCAALW